MSIKQDLFIKQNRIVLAKKELLEAKLDFKMTQEAARFESQIISKYNDVRTVCATSECVMMLSSNDILKDIDHVDIANYDNSTFSCTNITFSKSISLGKRIFKIKACPIQLNIMYSDKMHEDYMVMDYESVVPNCKNKSKLINTIELFILKYINKCKLNPLSYNYNKLQKLLNIK